MSFCELPDKRLGWRRVLATRGVSRQVLVFAGPGLHEPDLSKLHGLVENVRDLFVVPEIVLEDVNL